MIAKEILKEVLSRTSPENVSEMLGRGIYVEVYSGRNNRKYGFRIVEEKVGERHFLFEDDPRYQTAKLAQGAGIMVLQMLKRLNETGLLKKIYEQKKATIHSPETFPKS